MVGAMGHALASQRLPVPSLSTTYKFNIDARRCNVRVVVAERVAPDSQRLLQLLQRLGVASLGVIYHPNIVVQTCNVLMVVA